MNVLYLNDSLLAAELKSRGWNTYRLEQFTENMVSVGPTLEGINRVYKKQMVIGAGEFWVITGYHASMFMNPDEFAVFAQLEIDSSYSGTRLLQDADYHNVTKDTATVPKDLYQGFENCQIPVAGNLTMKYKLQDNNPPAWTNSFLANPVFCKVYGYRVIKTN